MAIYEPMAVRDRKTSRVKGWFRKPEKGETAKQMEESRKMFPVHPDDIAKAKQAEKERERQTVKEG